ncbi:MAG: DUF3040 domain-containing protein [Streptosporangiales bacterium]|nr:DUF3040 domain-containing protein [Streptosporangiales bacterium]
MPLSMGEERILAEIEHRLAEEDPALAYRLATFGRTPRLRGSSHGQHIRLRRWGIVGAIALLVVLFVTTIVAVTREPSKSGERQAPHWPPASPAVVVPDADKTAAGTGEG